ncbi:DUF2189 domain-containing protein [Rhodobacteraceae bacterium M382]|nr:DUF2189 domain-containing protein [Rhodobacteraceae bacterium M382]
MAKTIGNPASWTAHAMRETGSHVGASMEGIGSKDQTTAPLVRKLEFEDLTNALRAGFEDFMAARADVIFIALIYPLAGLVMITMGLSMNLIPLVVPMIMGFALLGPVAAVGLYEISRLREAGENPDWLDAFGIIRTPSFGGIVVLGLFLALLFIIWMIVAQFVYASTLGPEPPVSIATFAHDVFTTSQGWAMIILGTGTGVIFAIVALATSLVSFPLLLDRQIGLPIAVVTSFRVLRKSPLVTVSWGLIVGVLLAAGSLPILLGLIVVLPVLGHATWHLYRKAVV